MLGVQGTRISFGSWQSTRDPCIGRWILHHWTTRQVPRADRFWSQQGCTWFVLQLLPYKRFYSFWSLFFKFPFDWLHVIFDVLLVGFFHKGGFLQVMVHDNSNMSDYCAFSTLAFQAFRESISTNEWFINLPFVLLITFPFTSRHSPLWPPRSCRCWRTSHEGWCGPGR